MEKWSKERESGSPLSITDIVEIHKQVLIDIDENSAGRFRNERVLIKGTGFIPPAMRQFDVLIPALIDLANRKDLHPVLQAAELHYNLVAIHPFVDGNGRTARLLMNYHLLRNGLPCAIIEVGERGAYLSALDEANAGQTLPFANFIAKCVIRTIGRVIG